MSSTLRIAFGGYSTAGIKSVNEDAFAAHLPPGPARLTKGALAVIADGVSCSDNAQQASQTSVTTFIQDYLSTPESWDVKTAASRVLAALNSWLFAQGQATLARHDGFVTTLTALVLKSTTAHVLHCGDSRLYRWREGQLKQLTSDHTLRQAERNVLTRALGMDRDLKVDYQQRSARVGDIFVLTTDGLHEALLPAAFTSQLARLDDSTLQEGRSAVLEKAAHGLIEQALASGGDDNLSCLLVRVLELPVETVDEVHRKLTRLAIPPVLESGNRIDGYVIERVLHSGSRSHVYLASHPRFREKFVLKMLSPTVADSPLALDAFVREQWVGRRVDHPALMRIHEPVPDSRFLYHICDYVEGPTLKQWMYDHPRPEIHRVRDIASQIAVALRALQRGGMLHRDLKPDNVIVMANGSIKMIDYGAVYVSGLQEIQRPLDDHMPVGTADYMAPECLLGDGGIHRSDLFSLGVIVYEMLAGTLPFEPIPADVARLRDYGRWRYQSLLRHRPDLPLWVDLTLRKACAPNPVQRYAALSEFLHDLAVPNAALLAAHAHQPLIERHPVRFWQGVSLILLMVIVLQWYLLR